MHVPLCYNKILFGLIQDCGNSSALAFGEPAFCDAIKVFTDNTIAYIYIYHIFDTVHRIIEPSPRKCFADVEHFQHFWRKTSSVKLDKFTVIIVFSHIHSHFKIEYVSPNQCSQLPYTMLKRYAQLHVWVYRYGQIYWFGYRNLGIMIRFPHRWIPRTKGP